MVKRILIAGCSQEVSTFNPVLSTYEDFTVVFGDDVVERSMGKNSAIAGAVGLFRADGDIEVVSSYSSGATSTGPLEHGAWERISGEFLDALRPFAGEAEVNSCERLVTLNDAIVLHTAYTSPPKVFLFGGLFDFELPEEINTNANWDYGCRGNRQRHWGAAV